MGPDIIHIIRYKNERNIADLPWMIALKRRKAGVPSSIDAVVDPMCDNRSSFKLLSIDPNGRSITEAEAWSKVSNMQRRKRASWLYKCTWPASPPSQHSRTLFVAVGDVPCLH